MERLTERLGNKVINVKYANQHETAIHRLAAIEDILGDDYDLDRLRELAQADRDGRCMGGGSNLYREMGKIIVRCARLNSHGFMAMGILSLITAQTAAREWTVNRNERLH